MPSTPSRRRFGWRLVFALFFLATAAGSAAGALLATLVGMAL